MSFREFVLLAILVHISMLQLVGALQFPSKPKNETLFIIEFISCVGEHSGDAYRLLKSSVLGRSRFIPIERTLSEISFERTLFI